MRGIVFGSGASIDLLPDSFFSMIRDDFSFGVNRVVLSKRLKAAEYQCTKYGGMDRFHPDRAVDRYRLEAYRKLKSKVGLWLPESWDVDGITPPTAYHNSAEMGVRALLHMNLDLKEIWIVGCEVIGAHCETDPWLDPYETNCDGVFAAGAPMAWKNTADVLKVPLRVYPKWSLLHPYVTPHSIVLKETVQGLKTIHLETAPGR